MNHHRCEESCQKFEYFTTKMSRTSESVNNMFYNGPLLCPCDYCEERIKRDKKLVGGEEWAEYAEANLLCTRCGKSLEGEECWEFSLCKDCRGKVNSYGRVYERERVRTDVNFKLSKYLRSRLWHALKNNQKAGSAIGDLGCSISDLKKYLEYRFKLGMSWDNWGYYGWHIDHIIPLSSFDLTDRDQFLRACHYTNLQPLWAKENFSKGDRIK